MNTKQVEYFLELTQVLNYRQASEKLGITQPTLSKAMQHLENDLGFSLFYKQGRSIRLTRQGELFLPYAREALLQLDQGVRTALEQRQVLRLGCIGAIQADVLPAFLRIFERSFPGAYVRIHNSVSYTLQDMLEVLGDRRIALCRELTKLHEEIIRTTFSGALERYKEKSPRGEYVLIIEGAPEPEKTSLTLEEAAAPGKALRESGISVSDAAKQVAKQTGYKKGELYRLALEDENSTL